MHGSQWDYSLIPATTREDEIHTPWQIVERMKEQNVTAAYIFVEFKSTFDSTKREQLYDIMLKMGTPMKLINVKH
jgi:hypothetical protein